MKAIKQRKKLLSIILSIAMIFSIFSIVPLSASATNGDTFTDANGITYEVTDESVENSVSVKEFNNSTTEVIIPDKVENNGIKYTVNNIVKEAFRGNVSIESITIPGTIKEIVSGSFTSCSQLRTVTLGEGVETIATSAFQSCTSLDSIIFPKSMKSIAVSAFRSCSALKEITFNSDLELKSGSFNSCSALENVYCYSSNITFASATFSSMDTDIFTIHGYTGSTAEIFANTKSYKFSEITIDTTILEELLNQAKAIDKDLYTADSYAALVDVMNNAEKILEKFSPTSEEVEVCAKNLQDAINNLVVDDEGTGFTWKKIDDGKSVEITGLINNDTRDMKIPLEIKNLPVTSIGRDAFSGNDKISTVVIPASVTVIDDRAFRGCNYLQKITFAENSSLTKIGVEAFRSTTNPGLDKLSEVDLPASIKLLGNSAFYNRENLLKVTVNSPDVNFGTEVFSASNAGTSNVKIYGYDNSTAKAYAEENGHTFRYLDLDVKGLQEALAEAQAKDKSLYTDDSYKVLNQAIRDANIFIGKYQQTGDGSPSEVQELIKALNDAMAGLVLKATDATETTAPDTTEPTTVPDTTVPTTVETEPTSNSEPVYEEFILGDADGNGIVNIKDVTYIQLYLARL
ncbi:MAG: leucine-rich repeat domain-containing protein, partial [Ruminococcus sp.]|nr:leucine-rich repeat domain-containing protein [Ruminococcus sp.]